MNARKVTQKRTAENDAEYNKNESKKIKIDAEPKERMVARN